MNKADQLEMDDIDFLDRFPNGEILLSIAEVEVHDIYISLGLLKRSAYFLKMIEIIKDADKPLSQFSDEELNALPGVGNYTLNAIKCFGRGKGFRL